MVDQVQHPGKDMDGYSIFGAALLCSKDAYVLHQHLQLQDLSATKPCSTVSASGTCQPSVWFPFWEANLSQHLISIFGEEMAEGPWKCKIHGDNISDGY